VKKLQPNIPIQVKNAMPFPRVLCLLVEETVLPVGGCFRFSLICKKLFENVKSAIKSNLNYKSESLLLVNSFKFRYE